MGRRRRAAVAVAVVALLAGCASAGRGAVPDEEGHGVGGLDARFREGMAEVNGTRLHYVSGGQGSPLILLHGFPETWLAWRKVMPALAEHHTVVAVDLRGSGDSALEETGYDKETMAEDVYQLVRNLGLADVNLVGSDLGGMVAYAYARLHRDQVRRLVVVETRIPGFGLEESFDESYHFLFHMVPELPERLIEGREDYYLTRFICGPELDCRAAGVSQDLVDAYVAAYSRPGRLTAGLDLYRALPQDAEANRARALPKLAVPVLALGGELGIANQPLEQFGRVADDVTGGVVPGAGHWIADQRPHELARRIIAFTG